MEKYNIQGNVSEHLQLLYSYYLATHTCLTHSQHSQNHLLTVISPKRMISIWCYYGYAKCYQLELLVRFILKESDNHWDGLSVKAFVSSVHGLLGEKKCLTSMHLVLNFDAESIVITVKFNDA